MNTISIIVLILSSHLIINYNPKILVSCQNLNSSSEIPFFSSQLGSWNLLQESIGISAMHMQLLRNNKVVIYDRTDFGPSNLSLGSGRCRFDPSDTALQQDCTAHSSSTMSSSMLSGLSCSSLTLGAPMAPSSPTEPLSKPVFSTTVAMSFGLLVLAWMKIIVIGLRLQITWPDEDGMLPIKYCRMVE